jgi:RNA polymerase sigma-70 factor, ECF subfamily
MSIERMADNMTNALVTQAARPRPRGTVAMIPGSRAGQSLIAMLRPRGRKDTASPEPDRVTPASLSLTQRLRHRDPDALDSLYEQYSGRAFGLAYRILGDGPSAEDVVQEAFLWVWNSAERIDPRRGRVESLLLTIVHRRAIDSLRARTRRDSLRIELDPSLADERSADMFESIALRLSAQEIRRRVDQLSGEQREAIELAYFSGMTHREIAEAMHFPIGTVKSRIRLGMDHLRTSLGLGRSSKEGGGDVLR